MSLSLAVSVDRLPRMFGYDNGAGHGLMVPTDSLADPLAQSDGGTVCGKTLDIARLTEKATGDKMCKACEKRITDEMTDAAAAALYAALYPTEDGPADGIEPEGEGALFAADVVSGDLDSRVGKSAAKRIAAKGAHAAAVAAEERRLADQEEKRAAAAETAVTVTDEMREKVAAHVAQHGETLEMRRVRLAEIASKEGDDKRAAMSGTGTDKRPASTYVTDDAGKCAVEIAGEDGGTVLKAITGRMKLAPVAGSESVNGDGAPVGACPSCRKAVKLTASEMIGSHYPPERGGKTPKDIRLAERTVADVVADAAERKRTAEIDAERKRAAESAVAAKEARDAAKEARAAGNNASAEQLEAVAAVAENGSTFKAPRAPRTGNVSGDQGTEATRGAALVKGRDVPAIQPKSNHASTWDGGIGAERPDRKAVDGKPKAGEQYGTLTPGQVAKLGRGAQRNYWRGVAKRRKDAERAAAKERTQGVAAGKSIPSQEMRDRRKAASVGSFAAGHLSQNHVTSVHAESSLASQVGAGVVRDDSVDGENRQAVAAWHAASAAASAEMALRVARETKELARTVSLAAEPAKGGRRKGRMVRKGRKASA